MLWFWQKVLKSVRSDSTLHTSPHRKPSLYLINDCAYINTKRAIYAVLAASMSEANLRVVGYDKALYATEVDPMITDFITDNLHAIIRKFRGLSSQWHSTVEKALNRRDGKRLVDGATESDFMRLAAVLVRVKGKISEVSTTPMMRFDMFYQALRRDEDLTNIFQHLEFPRRNDGGIETFALPVLAHDEPYKVTEPHSYNSAKYIIFTVLSNNGGRRVDPALLDLLTDNIHWFSSGVGVKKLFANLLVARTTLLTRSPNIQFIDVKAFRSVMHMGKFNVYCDSIPSILEVGGNALPEVMEDWRARHAPSVYMNRVVVLLHELRLQGQDVRPIILKGFKNNAKSVMESLELVHRMLGNDTGLEAKFDMMGRVVGKGAAATQAERVVFDIMNDSVLGALNDLLTEGWDVKRYITDACRDPVIRNLFLVALNFHTTRKTLRIPAARKKRVTLLVPDTLKWNTATASPSLKM